MEAQPKHFTYCPPLNKMNVATTPNVDRKAYVPSLMYRGNHWNNRVVQQVSEWF